MKAIRAKLLFAARLRRLQASVSAPHDHADFWQAEYCMSGPIQYEVHGRLHRLPDGAVLLIPPAVPHRQESPKASDSYILKFQHADARRRVAQPTLLQLTGPERQIMEHLFKSIVYEHDGRSAHRERMIAALLDQALVWLARWVRMPSADRTPTRSDARERVRLVADMLRRQYARHLSIADMAAQASLSRSRFVEIFRREIGVSPALFHTRVRMDKAAEMARFTGMSWQQIASHLGFDDPAYFSRLFKHTMGASPSRFRQAR